MNLKEAMDFISVSHKFPKKPGLMRMKALLRHLGNPEKGPKFIHIAGTNGKGSVCAIINQCLVDLGYRVGLYISPYIEFFNERIQINNVNISNEDLIAYTERVKEATLKSLEEGIEHPTEFEIITAIMFLYFKEKKIDYGVIEVGLGGNLDSTNVLDPVLSIIASISYDHMGILGNSIEEIAKAKAGIIKRAPSISYPQIENVRKVLEEEAGKAGSSLTFIKEKDVKYTGFNEDKMLQSVSYRIEDSWETIQINLLGIHQLYNSLLAVQSMLKLKEINGIPLTRESLRNSLSKVRWMGRFETMNRNPLIIIDGAHNRDGIDKLKSSMDLYFENKEYILILGILKDKETHVMTDMIAKDAKAVICVTPHSERASLAKDLAEYIKNFNANTTYEENYENAINKAISLATPKDFIIVSGSLYMIGDMRKILRKR